MELPPFTHLHMRCFFRLFLEDDGRIGPKTRCRTASPYIHYWQKVSKQNPLSILGNDLGAHSDWSGTCMVQVSANLDVGNTLRHKIHPRQPTGRISPALRAGGSSSSPSSLPRYRIRTPRPCCCRIMFARANVMAWMGGKMGRGE